MSALDIDAIRERTNAATPGPWQAHDTHLEMGGHTATVLTKRAELTDTGLIGWLPTFSHQPWNEKTNAWANAEFVAASREDVPALLSEVDRLRRENAALQQVATRAEKDVATLTADRDQALEESARSYSQGVEDMREAAAKRVTLHAASHEHRILADAIRDLPVTPTVALAADATCTSRSTFHDGVTQRCRLPRGHSSVHQDGDRGWINEGADPEPVTEMANAVNRHPLTASHNATAPRDTELTQQVRALVKRYGAPNVAYAAAQQAGRH